MNLNEAEFFIRGEMERHGLIGKGWDMDFSSRMTRTHGTCNHRKKLLRFNTQFVEINNISKVHQTTLHEIAHALVEPRHGHNKVWRTKASEIGVVNPSPYSSGIPVPSKYIGVCPNGHFVDAHRKMRNSCGRCSSTYNPDYRFHYELRNKL